MRRAEHEGSVGFVVYPLSPSSGVALSRLRSLQVAYRLWLSLLLVLAGRRSMLALGSGRCCTTLLFRNVG